jgi:LPS sulfotransferase NodH
MHRHEMRILNDYLAANPETKIIHLKRNNHLDRYISTIITNKTSTAVMVDESGYKKKIEEMGLLTLDPEICDKEFKWREGEHNTFEQLLTNLNADVLQITYTELTKENKKTMSKVIEFLDLKPIDLITQQKKQNKKQKKDLIANYKELKSHFKDSEWGYLFNE